MNKLFFGSLFVAAALGLVACGNNEAHESNVLTKALTTIEKNKQKQNDGPVKPDGPAIAAVETEDYSFKVHRAFVFESKGSEVLANMQPKAGYKFVALDLSLRNRGSEKLDGGRLLLALRITDEKGNECKRSLPALAMYSTQFPEDNNQKEYDGMWGTLATNEFHRTVLCVLEAPAAANTFTVRLPGDKLRKSWKEATFSL